VVQFRDLDAVLQHLRPQSVQRIRKGQKEKQSERQFAASPVSIRP
jgi:hypothetical protein